jgi:aspartyl-tRNA(Asn)/glutamyl-tRNA(Gln) amidotransferase subunit C
MQVDEKLLTRLEKLSFLKIETNKREEIISQLSEMLSFVDNLSELDTDGIHDKFSMNKDATYLREDNPLSSDSISVSIMNNAPKSADNFFIVPKIID